MMCVVTMKLKTLLYEKFIDKNGCVHTNIRLGMDSSTYTSKLFD